MATARVFINLFRVRQSDDALDLPELLRRISADPIERRVRSINKTNYRLENVRQDGANTWYLDFVKFREGHGPGRVSRRKPLKGFDLDREDFFGEDTAAIYFAKQRYLVLQYNHWGVRSTAIAEYLSSYLDSPVSIYELRPKLDLDVERRLNDKPIVRRVEIGFDITKMTSDDLKADRSLADMTAIGGALGADKIYLSVSVAGRRSAKSLTANARRLAARFLHRVTPEAQLKMLVSAKDAPDSELEVMDLLEEKLTFGTPVALGPDRRFSFEDRCAALGRAALHWKSYLKEP